MFHCSRNGRQRENRANCLYQKNQLVAMDIMLSMTEAVAAAAAK